MNYDIMSIMVSWCDNRRNVHKLGKTSKKKMCKFCDILQIGWGGPGLKTHFKKDRNCDKVFGGVGEKRQCHNFHMLNICCFIGYKQHN